MKKLVDNLYQYLSENNLYTDGIDAYEDSDLPVIHLEVNISWGDWKHEHLRARYLVEDILNQTGWVIFRYDENVTEDDGSDCYSARHNWVIKQKI